MGFFVKRILYPKVYSTSCHSNLWREKHWQRRTTLAPTDLHCKRFFLKQKDSHKGLEQHVGVQVTIKNWANYPFKLHPATNSDAHFNMVLQWPSGNNLSSLLFKWTVKEKWFDFSLFSNVLFRNTLYTHSYYTQHPVFSVHFLLQANKASSTL